MHDATDDPPPKHRIATLLATGEGGTLGQVVDWLVMSLIVLNALLVMLETVGSLDASRSPTDRGTRPLRTTPVRGSRASSS